MMSGRGIEDLELHPHFDLSKAVACSFETEEEAQAEDLLRAHSIRQAAEKYPEHVGENANVLALKLERSGRGEEPTRSLASSVYMRQLRNRILSNVWALVEGVGVCNVKPFTAIPATWECSADALQYQEPARWKQGFASALYSRGAAEADGWTIGFLHGELDSISRVYRPHVHGIVYGGMVAVIDRLRELPNFESGSRLADGSISPVNRRLRMNWKTMTNLPDPITYLLQSYWPSRPVFIADESRTRGRKKSRIEEPCHSQLLLWQDLWRVADLTMMLGLKSMRDGLIKTSR